DPEQLALTIDLTRWLFPFVILVSLVSYCEGILNHRGHFFVPKIAPGLVSLSVVAAAVCLGGVMKVPIQSLVVGVLAGGLLHLLIQLPLLVARWRLPRLRLDFSPRFKRFMGEMGKVVLIGIFAQINIMVLRLLASFLPAGAVSHYWNANRLVDLTQGMIGVGLGSAIMPVLARAVAEERWSDVRGHLVYSLRLACFVLLPSVLFVTAFRVPLVAMLYRHGSFTWQDTLITADTLMLLAPFLLAVAGINIVKKVYFALDDRNTLLAVGAAGVVLTATLGFILIRSMAVRGLALALSLSTAAQLAAYFMLLRRKVSTAVRAGDILPGIGRMAAACLPAALVLYLLAAAGDWTRGPTRCINILLFTGGVVGSVAGYLGCAYLLRIPELRELSGMLRRKRRRGA
ncbi:hypothetical protein JW905_12755, partial [bacterium]|nr:hypothetical protein [candidate division CSSED10-310 bacterium]